MLYNALKRPTAEQFKISQDQQVRGVKRGWTKREDKRCDKAGAAMVKGTREEKVKVWRIMR